MHSITKEDWEWSKAGAREEKVTMNDMCWKMSGSKKNLLSDAKTERLIEFIRNIWTHTNFIDSFTSNFNHIECCQFCDLKWLTHDVWLSFNNALSSTNICHFKFDATILSFFNYFCDLENTPSLIYFYMFFWVICSFKLCYRETATVACVWNMEESIAQQ